MVTVTVTYSRSKTPAGKAAMIAEEFSGHTVTFIDNDGSAFRCVVTGTSRTPDDEPLVTVADPVTGEPGHVFAETIASVQTMAGE